MVLSSAQKLNPVAPAPWTLAEVAGRLVEISGTASSAALTIAFSLVCEAQQRGEPAGWVGSTRTCFYPPDAAQNGLDLASLIVVRLIGSARRHHTALLCPTEKSRAAFSLSSLVSLRVHAEKNRSVDRRFVCAL